MISIPCLGYGFELELLSFKLNVVGCIFGRVNLKDGNLGCLV